MKRHPADFMLWKPDPSHVMKWPSPWGDGYPGWHLECSVMAAALLANNGQLDRALIDLHSGGEDNIFPHHECEIAQSCCASGHRHFSRYWFHTRHLVVEGEKMSKSKGNFFTVRDLLAKGATPAAIRLELVRTHYRVNANFTLQGLKDCQRQIDRWARLYEWLGGKPGHVDAVDAESGANVAPAAGAATGGALVQALAEFKAALSDDLNVARAIAVLNEAAGQYDTGTAPNAATAKADLAALRAMNSVLGVLERNTQADAAAGESDAIESLIAARNAARASKDWKESDRLRDELLAMGIAIKDGPTGTTWTRVVR
jgi:cysteinyl-tRNA synthetase